jgi:hypothetical protein
LLLVLGCSVGVPATAALYRHVDETGKVSYSDRPQQPFQEALRLPPPNVATPEARRQLEIARQASAREEQAEFETRLRRWSAMQRTSPAAYSRPMSPYAPHYALPVYPVTFAQIPAQGFSSQGLRPTGSHHPAHNARR